MKTVLAILIAGPLLLLVVLPTHAQSCRAKAVQQSQAAGGAKILDVKQRKRKNGEVECIATFRVQKSKNQAPRVVTRRFKP